MPRWPRHRKLTLKVSYRGGESSWWLVESRGSHGVFPGYLVLEDVMAQVLNEPEHVEERGEKTPTPYRAGYND